MKVCNVKYGSILLVVFLVVTILICSLGLVNVNKYSCDNGLYISTDDLDSSNKFGLSNDCLTALSDKCNSKCSQKYSDRKCIECLNDHGCGKCIEGHLSEIMLIILLVISSILLLIKLYCMFSKKGTM